MTEPILPSWRPGATRDALLAFFDRVDEIPPADRVAVFDNDGTLWAEKPNYVQLDFLLSELRQAIAADPSVADQPELKALVEGGRAAIAEFGIERIAFALVDLHTGLTPAEFHRRARSFFDTYRHPERDVPVRGLRYRPMLELIDALRARGFDAYVVTGGGAEFVRVISEEFYGVKPEGVVGSQIAYDVERQDDGTVELIRTGELIGLGPNEGDVKPTSIQRILGRRPCVAGGNSAGDGEMLDYAQGYDGPSLALLVDHDDAEREFAYESVAGTFDAEESILDRAARSGWVVASMRDDWSLVFDPS